MQLDHLVYAGPDLALLTDALAGRHGLRAMPGGRHPSQGTHNALLGLGGGSYLELLAPDPEGEGGDWARSIAYLDGPALHAWCLRVEDAGAVATALEEAGLIARRAPGSRTRPDGSTLRWELVFAERAGFGGLMPFFVDWQGSAHPAADLPQAAGFVGLELRHPRGSALRRLLDGLGEVPAGVDIVDAADDRPWMRLRLDGPAGAVELSGAGGLMTGG